MSRDGSVEKIKEFELFARWMSISPILRLLSENELKKLGIDDIEDAVLLSIKTHGEFAEKFGVSPDTLTNWKQRDDFWVLVDKFKKEWGRRKTPTVLLGFYKKAVAEGDAQRVKLWLQYFENWIPKEESKISGDLPVILKVEKLNDGENNQITQ